MSANSKRHMAARCSLMKSESCRWLGLGEMIAHGLIVLCAFGVAPRQQIGRPLLIKGTLVQKPRFWLFKAKALAALAKAMQGREPFP